MRVRPIEPSDEPAYLEILEHTSEDDRYCRFFHVVNHFDHDDVRRFVEPDANTLGFIAEDDDGPLGVAHAFLREGTAELSIVVASGARRRGAGRALMRRLIDALHARGCTHVIAYALPENYAFARMVTSLGMRATARVGAATTWTFPKIASAREDRSIADDGISSTYVRER